MGFIVFYEMMMVSIFMDPDSVFDIEMLASHALEVCNFVTIGQKREHVHVSSTFLVKLLLPGSVLFNRIIIEAYNDI